MVEHRRSIKAYQKKKAKWLAQQGKPFEQKMAERDTARAIVKSLSSIDTQNGDIYFQNKNKGAIVEALLTSYYCVEHEVVHKRSHNRDWYRIDPKIISDVLDYVESQVLNCPITPCWWRPDEVSLFGEVEV